MTCGGCNRGGAGIPICDRPGGGDDPGVWIAAMDGREIRAGGAAVGGRVAAGDRREAADGNFGDGEPMTDCRSAPDGEPVTRLPVTGVLVSIGSGDGLATSLVTRGCGVASSGAVAALRTSGGGSFATVRS